ncbi:MAG: ATP-binding protein [Brachybacterium sp.]|uniref:ATP-binding protein n=1 Tax=Brachybacterium sp. TaxID=1891286 RepID=UPI00264A71B9|nr:putative DNA binding domain-containing protein [Brachybacterium sp.]MDN6328505.1 putative DNA binding domain-containing protein [Brachybacterium sp.]
MSTTYLHDLDAASPGDRLQRLIDAPEDQWFDRKSARIAPRDLARALVAFSNAEGGTVVIGIRDGAFDGDLISSDKENALRQTAVDFTLPPVRMEISRIALDDERSVLRLDIPPSEHVHETVSGEVYLRVGDESKKLTYAQRRELDYDRGSSHFEHEPVPELTLDDLVPEEFTHYRSAIGATADDATALRARSLLRRDGALTQAAALLFAEHPQEWLPQAFVRVTRFSEDFPGTGSRQNMESGKDQRFEGPIPRIIDAAAACIESWMPHRRALGSGGRFSDQSIVPKDAWLEGLVNAVVHRSYSMAGDHIRVNIFPSRIEIESPGRFPGLADPTRPLDIARYARNPRIARVCSDLGITQERGEGIRRIFEEMRLVGLADPEYHQTSGSVRLSLTALSRLSAEQQESLPPGSEEILSILRLHGRPLGTGDIVEETVRSRPWVRARLEELRASGLVHWEGRSARDPRAMWSLPT